MWAFLLTEILFFGGLFMAYMLYRTWYHDAFPRSELVDHALLGLLNTIVLIGSSLTMALAVRSAQLSRRQATVNWLLLTMVLGAGFLGVKVIEYTDKFEHHHVPGPNYVWEAPGHEAPHASSHGVSPDAPNFQLHTQIFFSLYFTMTGLHALHMIIGLGLMSWLTWTAWKGRYSAEYLTRRDERPLLALRRHRLDFPVPVAVSHRPVVALMASHSERTRSRHSRTSRRNAARAHHAVARLPGDLCDLDGVDRRHRRGGVRQPSPAQ